ncbi:MAG: ATP-binding protein [Thermodesulfobacteriota bacterium]
MKRYLEKHIGNDLKKKIVLLTGPRQAGKTTLSKMLTGSYDYYNFDNADHRLSLLEKSWDRSKALIIFDELHKLKNWKSWLKGVYDTEGVPPALLVTGSARLDTYRKMGDSLAGRYFQFRLHPLDLKEAMSLPDPGKAQDALDRLLVTGGFPEPFLNGGERFYRRWQKTHLDIIIKQDLIALENVQQITALETLIELLKRRVGSPLSYRSLAEDLQCTDKTVKRWLDILERMYVVFKIAPFHKNVARSLLKSPKFYFYDTGQVIGDSGAKLENLVACALIKEVHFLEDCFGERLRLCYLRTKDGKEIDFLVLRDEKPSLMLEVKWSGGALSPNFKVFEKYFPKTKKVQLVKEMDRAKTFPDGSEIRAAHQWLAAFSLAK